MLCPSWSGGWGASRAGSVAASSAACRGALRRPCHRRTRQPLHVSMPGVAASGVPQASHRLPSHVGHVVILPVAGQHEECHVGPSPSVSLLSDLRPRPLALPCRPVFLSSWAPWWRGVGRGGGWLGRWGGGAACWAWAGLRIAHRSAAVRAGQLRGSAPVSTPCGGGSCRSGVGGGGGDGGGGGGGWAAGAVGAAPAPVPVSVLGGVGGVGGRVFCVGMRGGLAAGGGVAGGGGCGDSRGKGEGGIHGRAPGGEGWPIAAGAEARRWSAQT